MATESKKSEMSIWNVNFNDLAKQICLKDLELFKAISVEEINSFHWTKASKKNLCPNLMISNKQFNKINLWVQKEILEQKVSLVGIKVLSKFINLSKRLLDLRNFQSAYAIKSALHSTPIYRLEYFWSEISKKNKVTWEKLSLVFNVEDNYNNLRLAIAESKRPCIPYIGVYLSDLTGLDTAFPKIDGIESEQRKIAMQKIYHSIEYFQSSKYDFKLNSGIQDYLHSMEYMEEFQNYIIDTLFNLSKALDNSSQDPDSPNIICPFKSNNQFHSHRKCRSLEPIEQGIYRRISENEREGVFVPNSESPTLLTKSENESKAIKIPKIRNLLDDSVVETKPDLSFSIEISIIKNGSVRGSISNIKQYDDNQSKNEIQITPSVQYNNTDMVSIGEQCTIVIEGSVKRKIKTKSSFCMPSYQKVLVRLLTNSSDCYLNFYMPKTARPKSVTDFREDSHLEISIANAQLQYKKKTFPKIIITLPNEIYILKSVDEVEGWPSIDQWWMIINESILINKSGKDPDSLQHDLINLDDEFTRL